jgi:hypothetical protein
LTTSRAANASLILVIVGWLVATYGVLSHFGDPDPRIPLSVIERDRHMAGACLIVGIASLVASIWLSGYAFQNARRRASIALGAFVLPFIVLCVFALR